MAANYNKLTPQNKLKSRRPDSTLAWSLAFAVYPVVIVFRRSGVEFPSFSVASFNLLSRVQRFIVFISQPECLADLFHHVLIGGRRGASNRFVSDVGSGPVGVNV